jgi:hypothetical protein
MATEREYTWCYLGLSSAFLQSAGALVPLLRRALIDGSPTDRQTASAVLVALRAGADAHKAPPMAAAAKDALLSALTTMIATAELPGTGVAGESALSEVEAALDDALGAVEALKVGLEGIDV